MILTVFYDGGVVEIAVNNSDQWIDIGPETFIKNGYNASISEDFENPLAGRLAFAGWSGQGDPAKNEYIESVAILSRHLLQSDTFKIRFRFATDKINVGSPGEGWYLDDIRLCELIPSYFPIIHR